MPSDNKLTATVVSWFLGLVTLVVIGFFGYVVNDLKEQMKDQTAAIDELTRATNAAILDRALSSRDIQELRREFDKHVSGVSP